MPQAVLEIVSPPSRFEHLPLAVAQRSSRTSGLLLILLLTPALAALVATLALLITFAAPVMDAARAHPVEALQVMAGLVIWAAIFIVPAKRALGRFRAHRLIEIEADSVKVTDYGLFGARTAHMPMTEFAGVAHMVRATLSGVHHELILAHPDPSRSLLLHTAPLMSRATLESASRLLGLPEIPAGELYRPRAAARALRAVVTPAPAAVAIESAPLSIAPDLPLTRAA